MTDTASLNDGREIHVVYLQVRRRKQLYSGVLLILFWAMFVAGWGVADRRNAGGFYNGAPRILDLPIEIVSEAWSAAHELPSHLIGLTPLLFETVNIAGASTLLGAFVGFLLSLLSTRGMAPWPRAIPFFRRIMDVARSMPEIVSALLLIFVLGGGPVPAMIAIALHTSGALGKLFSEVNENANLRPVEGLASTGANWTQRMWLGVLPQVLPNYLSYGLLRFEINIRASAILGFVGSGGIGYELRNAISWGTGRYDETAAIFALLFCTIVVVDQASSYFRNYLTKGGGATLPAGAAAVNRGVLVRRYRRKRFFSFGVLALVLMYLGYIFINFDMLGIAVRAKMDNAAILLRDSYSYKTVVEQDNRSGKIGVAIEGELKGRYADDKFPNWVIVDGETGRIDLKEGFNIEIDGSLTRFTVPGYGTIEVTRSARGVEAVLPEGEIPEWINISQNRLTVTTSNGRLAVTRAKTVVYRYFYGWELFWFTLDSPYYGRSVGELVALALSQDRIEAYRTNLAGITGDFWHNRMWRHGDVAWALFETILMAFLGTAGGALIGLPLAFAAASNFSISRILRFGVRRVFDFLRGVDALIWTIILSRAFGPGPLTGALAILLTETGTFGKIFSEALENVDENQIDGVSSTGARPAQRFRFGVIPQVMPILLSQVLYYLESNTRSATIIGAITGGGIGLLLTQAIITQKDWEEVTYYIVLILLMVMLMDSLSGWVRSRIITGTIQ